MLLKCSGRHAHYTDSTNELLSRAFRCFEAACPEGGGESFEIGSCWGLMTVITSINEECLVFASQQDAKNTSLVLVHTARRYL